MKRRIIIYISILGFFTAITLTSMKDIQNEKSVDRVMQQVKEPSEEDESVTLFKYLPVDW